MTASPIPNDRVGCGRVIIRDVAGMSSSYRREFAALHRAVAAMPLAETPLTSFWPMVGDGYNGEVMVIGRAVNSWRTEWRAGDAQSPEGLDTVVRDAVSVNSREPDPMDWVVRLWGNGGTRSDGFAPSTYNTARSAFWRVCRELCAAGPWFWDPGTWSGHLAWTNLYKIAPASGWNPAGNLLAAQRAGSAALLAREIDELAPRRVVALTGRSWFEPFAERLSLEVRWASGLVEGVADAGRRRFVIAKHPMGKPQARWLAEVRSALE